MIEKSCQPCWNSKIQCMLRGSGPPISKRPHMEELQTLRPPKKPRLEPVAVVQAPKKPEVDLKVKQNYPFHVWMASLMENLVSEMVRKWEVEERTAAALERLIVRGRPVFRSKAISEFCQLRPQTPSAFLGLRLPPSSRDASKDFLFQTPSSSPQCYHALLPFQPLARHPLQRLLREFHLLRR